MGGRAPESPRLSDVAILMGCYCGQEYLTEQLDSIRAQTHSRWKVWAADDGSADGTLAVLQRYRSSWGSERLEVRPGPQRGFVANFLALACDERIRAEYFAYADQDDVWAPEKLALAVDWLNSVPPHVPALYCSRTRLFKGGRTVGCSPCYRRPPSFAHALVQNIAGGNTMVFNQAARRLLVRAGADVSVVAHDWWTYLVVTACGGQVRFDERMTVNYRQHDDNQIGAGHGWAFLQRRVEGFFRGRFRQWVDGNLTALERLRMFFPPESERTFTLFSTARKAGLSARLSGLMRSGVHRQTAGGNCGLLLAALFNRI